MNESIYRCSTGEFVSETQIWERFEDGSWSPYCWDAENGAEWVRTDSGDGVKLLPVSPGDLPEEVVVVPRGHGVVVEPMATPR